MDNISSDWPKILWCIPFIKFTDVSLTLYHEIGHHVHRYIKPEYKNKELVADDYAKILSKRMGRRRYWYLFPFIFIIVIIGKIYKLIKKK